MANDFIGISVSGEETVFNTIKKLIAPGPYLRGLRRVAQRFIDEAGNYPPKQSVTRKQAYGRTFQSDKQRKFFFSALHSGRIKVPYRRTGGLRRGWKTIEGNYQITITNSSSAAQWVHGDTTQARMMKIIGWRRQSEILEKINKEGRIAEIISDELIKEIA